MNRDDVTRMAREAGFVGMDGDHGALRRFAALVAAAEREAGQKWFDAITAQHKQEILAEREACAKVADTISEDQWALYKGRPPYTGQELERASDYTQGKSDGAEVCAAAIRARRNK